MPICGSHIMLFLFWIVVMAFNQRDILSAVEKEKGKKLKKIKELWSMMDISDPEKRTFRPIYWERNFLLGVEIYAYDISGGNKINK